MSDLPDRYWLDEQDETDLCDHDDYDIDMLTGRARCDSCGLRWDASESQMRAYIVAHTP